MGKGWRKGDGVREGEGRGWIGRGQGKEWREGSEGGKKGGQGGKIRAEREGRN